MLGLGIGEKIGLLIGDEPKARVIGTGTGIVIDGSAIEISHVGYVENGNPFALTKVIYSVLTQGVVSDLKKRMVIAP